MSIDWYGHRSENVRIELLDLDENVLDRDYAQVSEVVMTASVHDPITRGGTLALSSMVNQEWLYRRIRIIYEANGVEFPRGIFLPATPKGPRGSLGESRSMDFYDKGLVLDEDIYTQTVSVAGGEMVVPRALTEAWSSGERPVIVQSTETARTAARFDRGISKLGFVNELLAMIAYDPLRMDDHGTLRSQPTIPPDRRTPTFVFNDGEYTGLYLDGWEDEEDLFKVPNRWMCISQEDGDNPALVSVMENLYGNDGWPYAFSREARGRWVSRVTENVEVASQEALDIICRANLTGASSARRILGFTCPWLPIAVDDVVEFHNSEHGIHSLVRITKLDESLNLPGATMTVRAWEVRGL